jgi:hypothetical protein
MEKGANLRAKAANGWEPIVPPRAVPDHRHANARCLLPCELAAPLRFVPDDSWARLRERFCANRRVHFAAQSGSFDAFQWLVAGRDIPVDTRSVPSSACAVPRPALFFQKPWYEASHECARTHARVGRRTDQGQTVAHLACAWMADDAPQLIEWLLQRCALVRHAVRNVRRTACDMQHVSMQEEMAVEYDIPLFPRKPSALAVSNAAFTTPAGVGRLMR